jgi:hypothetical protein
VEKPVDKWLQASAARVLTGFPALCRLREQ